MAERQVFGLLITFRRPTQLADTVTKLAAQTRPVDHLIVVDNAAEPAVAAVVEQYRAGGHPATYVPAPDNLGCAGGLALGMQTIIDGPAADEDWIVTLDDDDPPKSADLFAELLDFAETCRADHPDVGAAGLVGARFDWRRGRIAPVPDRELVGAVPVDYIGGGRFPFFSVAAVRAAGVPWAELFFGLDDLEYGLRLRAAGFGLYAHGERWLAQRRTSGRLGRSFAPSTRVGQPSWRRYYSQRNQVLILRRYRADAAAARVTAAMLAKPLVNAVRAPRTAAASFGMSARAARDGWTGRAGRTVEPASSASRPGRAGR